MGIAEGFSVGMSAGRSIRQGIDRQQALEYQRQRDRAVDEHRRFSEDLQTKQFALQQKQADNVLMTQMHGLLANPSLHPQAKAFMLDDIARQRGIDPKSEYYQGIKRVIVSMPADQARALTSGLIAAFPKMEPGAIGKTVDGLLTGGIPATAIPELIKSLNAARQTDEQTSAAAGIYGGASEQPGGASGTSGAPAGAIQGAPVGASDTFGAPNAAPPDTFSGAPGGVSGYGGPEGGPGMAQDGAPMNLPTDFSGQKDDFGGASGGTLTSPSGLTDQFIGEVGPMDPGPSPAQPGMAGQLDQMRGNMAEQGGVPPGGPLLKDLLGGGGPNAYSPDAPRQQTAPAPAMTAPQAAEAQPQAPVDPKSTPEFWLEAAGKFDMRGPAFKEYAAAARAQADALSKRAKQGLDTQKGQQKVSGAKVDDAAKAEGAITGIDETLNLLNELRTHPGMYTVAGRVPFGGEVDIRGTGVNYADLFPGTKGAEFFNKHKTLVSQVVLRTMQDLKAMSSQGATGFGALSQKELKVLEDSAGALQLTNSTPELVKSYDKFMDHLTAARTKLAERYQSKYGVGLNVGAPPEKLRVKDVTIESSLPFQMFGRKRITKPGHPDIQP